MKCEKSASIANVVVTQLMAVKPTARNAAA